MITGLSVKTSYRFTVAARNAAGTGPRSGFSNAVIVGAPGAPTAVRATKVAPGSLKVTFTAPAEQRCADHRVHRRLRLVEPRRQQDQTAPRPGPITVAGLTAGKHYACTVKASQQSRLVTGVEAVVDRERLTRRRSRRPGPSSRVARALEGRRVAGRSRVRRYAAAAVPAWKAIEQAEPEFAARVRRLFDAGRHKTIATLRADGSPRISGIECEFTDGDLRFGSMAASRKGADLERDPRFALHGPTFHPEEGKESDWPGEAKIAGRALPAGGTEAADEQPDGEVFVADITEVVVTGLDAEATKLVVESWTPERGLRRVERD